MRQYQGAHGECGSSRGLMLMVGAVVAGAVAQGGCRCSRGAHDECGRGRGVKVNVAVAGGSWWVRQKQQGTQGGHGSSRGAQGGCGSSRGSR